MQPTSQATIAQILHPTGFGATSNASDAAVSEPFTLAQVVHPRGPSAPVAASALRIDQAEVALPALV